MTSPSDYTNSAGTGINFGIPITLPAALGQSVAAIATGISDAGAPDPISVRRRWATVLAINADSTVDINLGGVTVPHVAYDASYHPALNEVVQVNVVDTDITVIGPTANATYVAYIRRTGTIAAVNRSAGAPGNPTTVNVTLTDAQSPQTLLNVPFVSEYFPVVGDNVMLGQGTNTQVYLVLGAVGRPFRRPTGDIEPTILSAAKPDTLLLQGQTVSRTTYAALWAWAQLNVLVGANLPFGVGDGSTTFTLPDFRGRVPVGAGTLGSDAYSIGVAGGAARVTLAANQMPSHTHSINFTSGASSGHQHGGTTATMNQNWVHSHGVPSAYTGETVHSHGGGFPGFASEGPNPGGQPAAYIGVGSTDTNHVHSFYTDGESGHTHAISGTSAATGGATPVDLRSPYIGINWLIYV
jgi:microcystin-dependent protein